MPHHIYIICNKEAKDIYLFGDDSKGASEYALNLATKQKVNPKNIEISIYRKRQNSSQLVKDYSFLLTDTVEEWTNRQKLEEEMTMETNQKLKGKLTKVDKAINQLDPTAPKIVCCLEKVEGGAIANGKIEGTYKDTVAMIALLITRVAKGDREETLEDIIRMAKALFNYDTAKERKHD